MGWTFLLGGMGGVLYDVRAEPGYSARAVALTLAVALGTGMAVAILRRKGPAVWGLMVAPMVALAATAADSVSRHRMADRVSSGECVVLEGRVRLIHRQVPTSRKPEIIEVGGEQLSYSVYDDRVGYRTPLNDGGILFEQRPVRLCVHDGVILRIEDLEPTAARTSH